MSTRFEMMSATAQAIYIYFLTILVPHLHMLNVRVRQIRCVVPKTTFPINIYSYLNFLGCYRFREMSKKNPHGTNVSGAPIIIVIKVAKISNM